MIKTAHKRAIVGVLERIEDEVAGTRYGSYWMRPPDGLVSACSAATRPVLAGPCCMTMCCRR
ncbi:hypothetical protein BF14_030520 [Streptomyces griseus]|nr:hypothetical protein DIJ69_30590 [Streptomyces globisporus]PPA43620.1 hypothetical protein BF14_030520 [Streptomyces griseus]RAN20864.1 hypothetical protein A3838_29860 [Streptomyces badius]RAN28793.1 hypothetical protein A3800_29870 [Streptomyces badius]